MSDLERISKTVLHILPDLLKCYKNFYKSFSEESCFNVRTKNNKTSVDLQYGTINLEHIDGGKLIIEFGTTGEDYESSYDNEFEECEINSSPGNVCIFLTNQVEWSADAVDIAALYNSTSKCISFPEGYENPILSGVYSFNTDADIQEVLFKIDLLGDYDVKSVEQVRANLDVIQSIKSLDIGEDVFLSIWNSTFPDGFEKEISLPTFGVLK